MTSKEPEYRLMRFRGVMVQLYTPQQMLTCCFTAREYIHKHTRKPLFWPTGFILEDDVVFQVSEQSMECFGVRGMGHPELAIIIIKASV